MFWIITLPQYFNSKIRKEYFFLLLREYEDGMSDAFLQAIFPKLMRMVEDEM